MAEGSIGGTPFNELPDSSYACIDPGGNKDAQGRTVQSHRHYPHHDKNGKVDPVHINNAWARLQQQGTTSCGYGHIAAHRRALQAAGSRRTAGG